MRGQRKKPPEFIPDGYKWCSKGNECLHPQGPILPSTLEYFNSDKSQKDGLYLWCKPCYKAYRNTQLVKNASPDRAQAILDLRKIRKINKELEEQGLRKCSKCGKIDKIENFDFFVCRRCVTARDHPERLENYKPQPQLIFGNKKLCTKCNKKKVFTAFGKRKNGSVDAYCKRCRASWARRYYKTTRGKLMAKVTNQRRQARKRNLIDDFSDEDWRYALNYFHGCCAVCGRQLNDLFGERIAAMDHWIPLSSPDCPGTTPTNIVPLCHGIDGCNSSKHNRDPIEWLEWKFGKRKSKQIIDRIEEYFASVSKDRRKFA